MIRTRSFRRHQSYRHMWRRLKEDRNQHYERLDCACWTDPKAMARFKEQPKINQCYCCSNRRRNPWNTLPDRLTMQEKRHDILSPIRNLCHELQTQEGSHMH